MTEQLFLMTYGSPMLQALVGLVRGTRRADARRERDALREAGAGPLSAELEAKLRNRRAVEAALRSIAYVRMAEGAADERGFAMILKA